MPLTCLNSCAIRKRSRQCFVASGGRLAVLKPEEVLRRSEDSMKTPFFHEFGSFVAYETLGFAVEGTGSAPSSVKDGARVSR